MGREIRRVPPDWQHPRYTKEDAPRSGQVGQYKRLHDKDYESACQEWLAGLDLWRAGKHKDQSGEWASASDCKYFWEWDGSPPSRESYRDRAWTEAEATAFQVYETVSEGTPVTPVFPTIEALVDHLASVGTDWDDGKPWNRSAAENFAKHAWAPSLVVVASDDGAKIYEPRDGMPE